MKLGPGWRSSRLWNAGAAGKVCGVGSGKGSHRWWAWVRRRILMTFKVRFDCRVFSVFILPRSLVVLCKWCYFEITTNCTRKIRISYIVWSVSNAFFPFVFYIYLLKYLFTKIAGFSSPLPLSILFFLNLHLFLCCVLSCPFWFPISFCWCSLLSTRGSIWSCNVFLVSLTDSNMFCNMDEIKICWVRISLVLALAEL